MVRRSIEDGIPIPPFLLKCYDMVDDPPTEALISWSPNNDNSFVIWDENVFAAQLLPKYFKTNTLASFVRQLNIYFSNHGRLVLFLGSGAF
ncbi:hypothetical protein RJ639_019147 [Escallonia herrerae]|uniref:HSF-type DNA-binding domain-containing protein n=1 Tax=Escallonia herrerae TaxID=1293975 RepID=A0AA88VBP8_9ASTE|nr:hypothetical protein RJ639_019147 [Escallonia herrerae]